MAHCGVPTAGNPPVLFGQGGTAAAGPYNITVDSFQSCPRTGQGWDGRRRRGVGPTRLPPLPERPFALKARVLRIPELGLQNGERLAPIDWLLCGREPALLR
jgi:hypothetical protein